jgi:hypothetical protein
MRGMSAFLLIWFMGCATGYHASTFAGGFQQTRLGVGMYQVRFRGNGFTSHDVVSNYLLRRCAELTLESGSRYFEVGDMAHQTTTSVVATGASVTSINFPSGEVLVRISPPGATSGLDAVTIIQETDEDADGELSDAARATLSKFVPGQNAVAHN